MALSGTFYGTSNNQYVQPKIVWSATQSITGNYSTVTATLYYSRTNTGYTTHGQHASFSLTINSNKKTDNDKAISITYNSNSVAISHTVKVNHNDDGTKQITISATGGISGTSFTSTTISSKITLDTIPRKSTLSKVENGTLDKSQTITVTRQSTSFTHSIKAVCGSSTLYIKADGTTSTSEVKHGDCSIPFKPPISWASQNKTGTTVSVKYTITTYSGTTKIGDPVSYTKTCTIPDSVKPSVSITVSDAAGYATTYGKYIQTKSKLTIVIEVDTSGSYGSTIKSYRTTADGKTYTTSSITTSVIEGSGTLEIKTTVTDSRGRTATATKSINVAPYEVPKISTLEVRRCNEDGTDNPTAGKYGKIIFDSKVKDIGNNSQMSVTYTLGYKKTGENTYTEELLSTYANNFAVTDGEYIFPSDGRYLDGSSYDVRLTIGYPIEPCAKVVQLSSIKKLWSMLKKTTVYEVIFDSMTGEYTVGGEIDGDAWFKVTSHVPVGYTTDGRPVYEYQLDESGLYYLCRSDQTEISGIALNKIAELHDVFDIGFQTRFTGGIMHPYLEPNTDLDDVRTPNTYIGANVSTYNYANCPLTSGTFTLEVLGMGDNGQVMQRLTQCNRITSIYYERHYYQSSGWGPWYGDWQEANLTSKFIVYGTSDSNKPKYRKDGRLVEIRGQITPAVNIEGSADMHTIFTLPEGYRPNSVIYVTCQGSGACTWLLRVTPGGSVDFSRYRDGSGFIDVVAATSTSSTWLPFQVTFLAG